MILTNAATIDFSKYNKLITIGCSFTQWYWPEWGDILVKQNPNLELVNYGKFGSGIDYAFHTLTGLIADGTINDRTLVAIMTSSFHRDDTYSLMPTEEIRKLAINNELHLAFNDYTLNISENWQNNSDLIQLKWMNSNEVNCNDSRGYLIKTLSMLAGINSLLNACAGDSFILHSLNPDKQFTYDNSCIIDTPINDVIDLYKHMHTPISDIDLLGHAIDHRFGQVPMARWSNGGSGEGEELDYHPCPSSHANYLKDIGFKISQQTQDWAQHYTDIIKNNDMNTIINDNKWKWQGVCRLRLPH